MGSHVTPDGALGSDRRSAGDVGVWLNSYPCHPESALCVGRDLAASMRDFILRQVSIATRIHVSAMSDSWLRMHEKDYHKHRAEP
jgi:hypothetical protein